MNRHPRPSLALMCALALACGLSAVSCGEKNNKRQTSTNMFKSDGEFARGRVDGKRDAQWSMLDDSAAWMWLWMADEQYGQGYRQGWTEGRAEIRFRQEEKRARKDTNRDESDPNTN
ncbi:MAG: hypothetical protein IPK83_11610 [Planctomycetes bacterium]|nr:hypothetical protein [Planctomycetota bacterium]